MKPYSVVLLAVLALSPAYAADSRGVLAATSAVALDVDGIEDELAPYGLDRGRILEGMTARLHAAGVEVAPADALRADEHAGVLRLRVRLMRTLYFFYLYNVNLTLHSRLPLQGGAGYTTVETWSDGWIGSVQPTDVGVLGRYAAELVDRFIAARAADR
jgi:hypothetical protein